jgi:hypothetical protein
LQGNIAIGGRHLIWGKLQFGHKNNATMLFWSKPATGVTPPVAFIGAARFQKRAAPFFQSPVSALRKFPFSSESLEARRHSVCDPGHRSYDLSHRARRVLRRHLPGAVKITNTNQ